MLVSCQNKESIFIEKLEANNWFDKFGNEFKFENGKIGTKPYLGKLWWEIGNFEIQNKSLIITYKQDSTKQFVTKIRSFEEDKVVFDKQIEACHSLIPEKEAKRIFEIWRDFELLKDKKEKLSSIKFIVKPQPEFECKIRNFKIYNNRKVEIGFKDGESIDTVYFLDELLFSNIENLIQILPVEEYKEEYEFEMMHSADYEIKIVTNKASKLINSKGALPRGLSELFKYINFELEAP